MGVLGLWQLLNPTSRSIKLESLEGKILAIDISIWLHQIAKSGNTNKNAHLILLYNRICKLLYFKIKPIFVFDGVEVPLFKKRVLQERQKRRQVASSKAKEIDNKLKKNLLEQFLLNKLNNNNNNDHTNKIIKTTQKNTRDDTNDLFELNNLNSNLKEIDTTKSNAVNNDDNDDGDYDDDEMCNNLIDINYDINSIDKETFEQLPIDIQLELLSNYKEKLKNKRGQLMQEYPDKTEDFSSFQMSALLHKSEIARKLNNLKKSVKTQNINLPSESSFDNVFHEKISSEDDRVLLYLSNKTNDNHKVDFLRVSSQTPIDVDLINDQNKLFQNKAQHFLNIYRNKNELNDSSIEMQNNVEDIFVDYETISNTSTSDVSQENETNLQEAIWESAIEESGRVMRDTSDNQFKAKSNSLTRKIKKFEEINSTNNQTTTESNKSEMVKVSLSSSFTIESDNVTRSKTTARSTDDLNPPEKKIQKIEQITLVNKKSEIQKSDSDLLNVADVVSSHKGTTLLPNRVSSTMVELNELVENTNTPLLKEYSNSPNPRTSPSTATLSSDEDDDFVEVLINVDKEIEIGQEDEEDEVNVKNQKELIESPFEDKKQEVIVIDTSEREIELNKETEYLQKEKQRELKLSSNVENYIIEDSKHLLQLFGIPYILSPGEAEAQCAYLDLTNQTNGTITEDSDIWLFGAQQVYRNFFRQGEEYIESYTQTLIKSQLGLDRDTLICLAMLVGSDYTQGIDNVGIVKAMEILQEFDGENFEKLNNFKKWHTEMKSRENSKFNLTKIQLQLLKLIIADDFPNEAVYSAYKSPNIDLSTDEFTWSIPDVYLIRQYLHAKLNWENKKIDDTLLPVIKRMNDLKIQKTIDNFFTLQAQSILHKQSKRMKTAINLFKKKNTQSRTLPSDHDNKSEEEEKQITSSINASNNELNLSDEESDLNESKMAACLLTNKKASKKSTKKSTAMTATRKSRKRKSD